MLTLNKQIEELLGIGLSVNTITEKLGITFDKLCEELNEHPELLNRMKSLYPKYDFSIKPKKAQTVRKKQPKVVYEDVESREKLEDSENGVIREGQN